MPNANYHWRDIKLGGFVMYAGRWWTAYGLDYLGAARVRLRVIPGRPPQVEIGRAWIMLTEVDRAHVRHVRDVLTEGQGA